MDKSTLKQRIFEAIERRADEIIGMGEKIRTHPELGFKEVKTARLVEETFGRLGLRAKGGLALTGVRSALSRTPAPIVARGPMDAPYPITAPGPMTAGLQSRVDKLVPAGG